MHQLDIPMAQSGGPFQMAFHSRSTRLPTAGDRQKDHRQQPESEPIFSLLERKYGVPLIEAEYKLDAAAAESEVAAALKVKPRSPILRIERTSYSTGSRPVDYETLYYRGDLVQFVTRLVRKIPH